MKLLILAGPNGAGKTTIAESLLKEIGIEEFVNVDQIAKGLSMLHPSSVAFQAGRIALGRIGQLISERSEFAIETTLSSQSILRLIQQAKSFGFEVIVHFYALPDQNIAIERVKCRVELGGHDIPEDTIRRRFQRGLKIFFSRVLLEVDRWYFYQNLDQPELLAYKKGNITIIKELFNDYKIKFEGR